MRLVMFRMDEGPARPGVVTGDSVIALRASSVRDVVSGGQDALAAAADEASQAAGPEVALADVALEPPLRPAVVVAPGPRLDPEHEDRLAKHREFYLKSAHTLIGPTGTIPYRPALGTLSYRAQVGLVMGTTPRHAPAGTVLDGVLGAVLAAELYSIDLLRVGWEGTMWHVRYGEGASFDGACPIGGFFVSADEFELDGLPLEDSTQTSKVRREDVAGFVSYVSRWMTLGPSTLVLAGSSHGPLLSIEDREPVLRFPELEAQVREVGRITARSAPLGEIDIRIGAPAPGEG